MNIQKVIKPPLIHRISEQRDNGSVIAVCGHWFYLYTSEETTKDVTCKTCLIHLSGGLTSREKAELAKAISQATVGGSSEEKTTQESLG